MTFNLFMRDTSGRGYKVVHEFNTAQEREDFVRERLTSYSDDEFAEIVSTLESGSRWHDDEDRTEYEYL